MITAHKHTVQEILENKNTDKCPLPLEVIPNHMGINLSSVDAFEWARQEDGQLLTVIINFTPA